MEIAKIIEFCHNLMLLCIFPIFITTIIREQSKDIRNQQKSCTLEMFQGMHLMLMHIFLRDRYKLLINFALNAEMMSRQP